jgi:hypothetical protein
MLSFVVPGSANKQWFTFKLTCRQERGMHVETPGRGSRDGVKCRSAPHLAHNVESMPEQQVVIAVNASLRPSVSAWSTHCAYESGRTPSEFSMGSTARSTMNCSTACDTRAR